MNATAGADMSPVGQAVAGRVRAKDGPLRFDEVVELALYHPDHGFYETGGGAGRQGHFLTSPEVGSLFGAVLARALDSWWRELGEPDPFIVVEVGAGRGSLAAAILGAEPGCRPALRYVAVERSAALRRQHPRGVESTSEFLTQPFTGVVLANELLDNLPFRLLQRDSAGWQEIHVDDKLGEVLVPGPDVVGAGLAPDAPIGARIPVQDRAVAWLETMLAQVAQGRVVVVDYADSTPSMAWRPWTDWVRTYREHARGGRPLSALGHQDVTCEVAIDQLSAVRRPDSDRSQAEFLRAHGIDDLEAEARRAWSERAHIGDLQALVARSRVGEAAALTDPVGLGAFRVLEWVQRPDGTPPNPKEEALRAG